MKKKNGKYRKSPIALVAIGAAVGSLSIIAIRRKKMYEEELGREVSWNEFYHGLGDYEIS